MDWKKFRNEISFEDGRRMTKRDWIVLLVLCAVYSLVAFLNLGALRSPQTVWKADAGTTVVADLGDETDVTELRFYGAIATGELELYDDSAFIDGYFTPGQTEPLATYSQENGDMFKWNDVSFETSTRYLILYVESGSVALCEMAAFDGTEQIPLSVYNPVDGAEKLTDEQGKVPASAGYLNNMYFDEIYHARTAYEMVQNDDLALEFGREYAAENGYSIYEWTHPSLGKLLIAVGIRIFGMTPFGWRFSGTLFGVFILAVLYVLSKRLFRRTDFALVSTGLMAVDCMHFAQTRIATIDVYALFFTLLMFLFMFDYICEDFEARPFWKKLVALGLSGVAFGLGASSKWTCLYSGAGLAVLYFGDLAYNLVRLIRQRLHTAKEQRKIAPVNVLAYLPVLFVIVVIVLLLSGKWLNWESYRYASGAGTRWDANRIGKDVIELFLTSKVILHGLLGTTLAAIVSSVAFRLLLRKREDVDLSLNNLLMTPVWCCLFFIAIPLVLYWASNYCYYIENKNCGTLVEQLKTLWDEQVSMYHYHANLDATHQCQSMWYQWPLAQKSVWFYAGYPEIGEIKLLSNISSTGNPAVWYVSAFGTVFALVEWFRNPDCRKDRAFAFVLVGILAGLLPWALVTRCVFLYHYFSTLPFVMLMTLLLLFYAEKKYPRLYKLKWIWLCVAAVEFVLMYPAISGLPVPYGYAKFIENVLAVFGKVYYVGV